MQDRQSACNLLKAYRPFVIRFQLHIIYEQAYASSVQMLPETVESDNKRKWIWAILFIELAVAGASVTSALTQGGELVTEPLGVLLGFIVATVAALLYGTWWTDYEEQRRDHPGTYHDAKT
jgi:hypothetical protein